jgi:hypothetical protein
MFQVRGILLVLVWEQGQEQVKKHPNPQVKILTHKAQLCTNYTF